MTNLYQAEEKTNQDDWPLSTWYTNTLVFNCNLSFFVQPQDQDLVLITPYKTKITLKVLQALKLSITYKSNVSLKYS